MWPEAGKGKWKAGVSGYLAVLSGGQVGLLEMQIPGPPLSNLVYLWRWELGLSFWVSLLHMVHENHVTEVGRWC